MISNYLNGIFSYFYINIYYMNRIDYIIVSDRAVKSICEWRKDGVYLISQKREMNINEMFKIDSNETLSLIDDFIDRCEYRKHLIQLKEIKNYLLTKNDF